jgi:Kelch motif
MAGTWQGLTHQPSFNTSTMILLSDGRVMVQEEATPHWHALSPDIHGSYVNGAWSPLADMSFWRRYYASGMLKDGRIVLIGGEQSGAGGDTNKGEIYDPVSDSWSSIPSPPGWTEVGDASCCILPDGRLMIGALTSPQCAI